MSVLISDNGQVVRGGGAGAQSRPVQARRRIDHRRFLPDREPERCRELVQVLLVVEAVVDRARRQSRVHLPDTGYLQEAGILDLQLFAKW